MAADDGLRALLHSHLPQVHWQAIEVGLVGRGVPDTNGCHQGAEFWIECKSTDYWSINLEPEQVGWLLRRHRAGGRTFVAVRRRFAARPRSPACDELWLCRGSAARELKDAGLDGAPPGAVLGRWHRGPKSWDWPSVLDLLVAWPLQ